MGSISSSLTNRSKEGDSYDMGNFDFVVLDDLLIDILVHVPPLDLIKNCRAVCKEWKELIDGQSIWKIKCQRSNRTIPAIKFDLPEHFFRDIFFFNPYGRNLIENPYGEDGLKGWQLTKNGGDGFVVENSPAGADPVPSEVGSQSCFATACLPCTKHQMIDLYREGVSKEVLQMETTKIRVSEWYAARFDCAAEYSLRVILCNGNHRVAFDYVPDNSIEDEFGFDFSENQWVGKEWHKVTHEFKNVGNVRYVFFQHHGKDLQFWAGHYGTKMTGATVEIVV